MISTDTEKMLFMLGTMATMLGFVLEKSLPETVALFAEDYDTASKNPGYDELRATFADAGLVPPLYDPFDVIDDFVAELDRLPEIPVSGATMVRARQLLEARKGSRS